MCSLLLPTSHSLPHPACTSHAAEPRTCSVGCRYRKMEICVGSPSAMLASTAPTMAFAASPPLSSLAAATAMISSSSPSKPLSRAKTPPPALLQAILPTAPPNTIRSPALGHKPHVPPQATDRAWGTAGAALEETTARVAAVTATAATTTMRRPSSGPCSADPSFLFKFGTKVVIDSCCATFAEVQKRGEDFWAVFELYDPWTDMHTTV
uniref:Uncharacterized protein n=1 Tax=Oryza meridionalis TaxID=40149 RepID=A0A0E0F595_9ORYZ